MSAKERKRKSVFDEVTAGRLNLRQASERLSLSYRQCRRSYKRFTKQGDAGLVHRNRGRPSNRRIATRVCDKIVARYCERYKGFGPTLAAEKLAKDGFGVDHETLRRMLIEKGKWSVHRKRAKHRQSRQRKAHFGELIQMDGSHHNWFGPDKGKSCLMNMVDDATGTTLSLMAEEETTGAAMVLVWRWIERYGVPEALYTDRKSVYVTDREPTLEEQLADETPKTAVGKACAKLDTQIICAHSPQAKGRVERNHGVYQDRFVKELALRGITTIAGANKLLENGFIHELNAKFAQAPASDEDFHCIVPKALDLANVFCFEDERSVSNDWCVRHANHYYQILKDNRPLPKPKDKVVVRTRLDGSVHLLYRGRPLQFKALTPRQLAKEQKKDPPHKGRAEAPTKVQSKPKPARTPWRQNCILMFSNTDKDSS